MTLDELKARRTAYVNAELEVLRGAQEYRVGEGGTGRTVRRADLAEIRQEIQRLDAQITQLEAQAAAVRRTFRGVPTSM